MKESIYNQENDALKKANFREVLYTSEHLQVALMNLKPLEETGEEIHSGIVQLFRFEGGKGICTVDGNEFSVDNGDKIVIPAGAKYNVKNTDSRNELKLHIFNTPPLNKQNFSNVSDLCT